MIKLAALRAFLVELDLVAVENIDSWAENIRFEGVCKDLGNGMVLFRQQYDAVISIERFPHTRHPVELLFGQLCAWLIDNDAEREDQGVDQPTVDADILDNHTADLDITIPFIEDVEVVPDENGLISINGQKYMLANVEIDYAEQGEVKTDGD
ncbi:phage tail protein [Methylophaga sp. OBS4]|uniref:phage tail protein n=1 Tax=Methylophaga sp. OBS4 TaxID=2991935 RepID=UPI00224EA230|nr:phage tail protein [Methylophaga sp. OBS4]MCX4187173.1 phage tail protein [Methylophaga sp. OBS4]